MESATNKEKYYIIEAKETDIKRIIEMRMKLESYLDTCNANLWHISPYYIDDLPSKYLHMLKDDQFKVLIVVNETTNDVVGMATGRIIHNEMFNHKKTGKLDDVWIDEEHRNRGLCMSLTNRIIDFFRGNNIKHMTLEYVSGNESAAMVWQKMGFEPVIIIANRTLDSIKKN